MVPRCCRQRPVVRTIAGTLVLASCMFLQAAGGDDDRDRPAPAESAAPISAEDRDFFEKRIRPVLAAECFDCHSAEAGKKQRGKLALNTPDGLKAGGESGPVIVPGKPSYSLLIKAIRHADPELSMPPRKKLDAQVVLDFEEWIRRGAPDPRMASSKVRRAADLESGRSHWAFRPPQVGPAPAVRNVAWPRTDIDRYILAAQEAKGLSPVANSDRRILLRRVTFDLTGLPPAPELADEFAEDASEDALERIVDRLLASPQFGEKWARHWLDVARYAESTGKTANFALPYAWRYRDYVIAALNADKPYDQFIQEQLAGDLLESADPRVTAERLIATGFLALGPKTLNERSGLQFELDVVDEQIDVTTQAFLGLTVACARCHDHKFDPIPQEDYYALAGIFRSTETCYGTVRFINAQRPAPLLTLPAAANAPAGTGKLTDSERKRIEGQMEVVRNSMKAMQDQVQKFFATGQLSLLQAQLDAYDADGNPKSLAMGVRDKPAGSSFSFRRSRFNGFAGFTYDGTRQIADSPVYVRGEPDQPGAAKVPRGTLRVIATTPLTISAAGSGRRELASWIASRENPLTARVIVNRLWMQIFGRGLVATAEDFGFAGRPPTHPELLDHLALQFMNDGWSIKKLIKSLVMSHVYQLSSVADPQAGELDPDNTWLWRTAPRRLDAESLRDALLAVSGQLDTNAPVGSAVARAGEGPVTRPRFGSDPIAAAINDPRNNHRSIYLPIVRDNFPESLALFDAADPSLITVSRPQTTVPSQGLYLLNNAFVLRAADATADRLLSQFTGPDRIREAYRRLYSRHPSEAEQAAVEAFLNEYRQQLTGERGVRTSRTIREREAWSALCQALFASAEFQYRR